MMEHLRDEFARELGRVGEAGSGSTVMPRVVDVWRDAVGPTIARNAWPARVARDGTLHVATESSAWAFELQQLGAEILGRLREALGAEAPSSLRFAVGQLPGLDAEDLRTSRRPTREPTAEERELAAALASRIEDEELRKVVAKAAAQSLAAAASDRAFW
jgi:hypothetical protein